MAELYANKYIAYLQNAISNDQNDTTLIVNIAPPAALQETGTWRIRVENELMLVTNVDQDGITLTVVRGVEGTTIEEHQEGTYVAHVLTAEAFESLLNAVVAGDHTHNAIDVDFDDTSAQLTADNVQEAINVVDTRLDDIAADNVPFDDSSVNYSAANVQSAIEQVTYRTDGSDIDIETTGGANPDINLYAGRRVTITADGNGNDRPFIQLDDTSILLQGDTYFDIEVDNGSIYAYGNEGIQLDAGNGVVNPDRAVQLTSGTGGKAAIDMPVKIQGRTGDINSNILAIDADLNQVSDPVKITLTKTSAPFTVYEYLKLDNQGNLTVYGTVVSANPIPIISWAQDGTIEDGIGVHYFTIPYNFTLDRIEGTMSAPSTEDFKISLQKATIAAGPSWSTTPLVNDTTLIANGALAGSINSIGSPNVVSGDRLRLDISTFTDNVTELNPVITVWAIKDID